MLSSMLRKGWLSMLKSILVPLRQRLLFISKQAQTDLARSPEGSLDISHTRGFTQYRHRLTNRQVLYLGKDESSLAMRLAQKSYARMILSEAGKEITAIDKALVAFEKCGDNGLSSSALSICEPKSHSLHLPAFHLGLQGIESIYNNLPEEKRKLVTPYVVPTAEFVVEWESNKVESGQIFGQGALYQTERGENVRSKSEVIIADKLFHAGIPYKYEQPFETASGYLYPDFTVLRTSTRDEIVWEHFGLMDNVDYCNRCIKKLNAYSQEGIFPGKGMIATFETSSSPLNIRQIDQIISMIQDEYVDFSIFSQPSTYS